MIKAELDPASFRSFARTLQALADATDRPVEEVLRQQGRLLARDLALHIHPRGLAPAKGRDFRDTISTKILSIYRPVNWMANLIETVGRNPSASKAFVKLVRNGNFREARRLLDRLALPIRATFIAIGPFDGGRLHREWRFRQRRGYPLMIVTDYQSAKDYARQKANLAGLAKGALVKAGKDLDGKTTKVPAWITRHTTAPGRGVLRRLRDGFHGSIQSTLRYAREALPFSEEMRAMDVREEIARKLLDRITTHNIRKAMSRGRRR